MKNNFNWRTMYLLLADFIVPIPLTILMYYLWLEQSGSSLFSFFILLLGLIFGYIIPGIAANLFKLWKFTWPYQWKNIFITHGFIYSSFFSLVFYLSFPSGLEISLLNYIRIMLASFSMFAIICSHHEIVAIKQGMIVSYNSVAVKGKSAVEMVAYFSFFCFGFLGAAFALAGLYAYDIIVMNGITDSSAILILFFKCQVILIVGSSPYFIKERKHIIENRKSKKYGK